jgi:hypothetical protein
MQRRYKQLVPHGGPNQIIPMECNLEMISVTLSQWCTEERLEHPHTKASDPTPARVFEVGPPIEDFAAVHLADASCTVYFSFVILIASKDTTVHPTLHILHSSKIPTTPHPVDCLYICIYITSPTTSRFLDFISEIFHLFHNAAANRFTVFPYHWGRLLMEYPGSSRIRVYIPQIPGPGPPHFSQSRPDRPLDLQT